MKRRYLKREIERETLSIQKKSRRSIKNLLEKKKKRAKNSTYLFDLKRLREREKARKRQRIKERYLNLKKREKPILLEKKTLRNRES